MSRGMTRILALLGVIAILGSLVLHLVAGTACLRARPVSDCQRCCERGTTSQSQAQASSCSLFCCTGLPGGVKIPVPPALSLAIVLPAMHDLSVHRAPSPPPPRFSLLIHARFVTVR
jgi:hypothetical protein